MNNIKSYKLILILLFIVFLQSFISYDIISRIKVIRIADEATYLKRGLQFYYIIFENKYNFNFMQILDEILKIQQKAIDRPPFLFLVQAVGWKTLKFLNVWDENFLIILVNTLFSIILVLSCYGIGKLLFNNIVGFISTLLTIFTPIIFAYTRVMTTDFPLACMTCLSFYFLLKTEYFKVKIFTLFSAIAVSLSQLTRETFFIYFIPVFVYYVIESFKNSKDIFIMKKNLFLFFILCFVFLSPVFLDPESFYAYKKYIGLSQLLVERSSWFYYLFNFNSLLGNLIFNFSILFFILIVLNRGSLKFLLIWFFSPILLYSLLENRSLRFIMPIVPSYFLIIVSSVYNFNINNFLKNFYLLFLVIISILQYFVISYSDYSQLLNLKGRGYEFVRFISVKDFDKFRYFNVVSEIIKVFRKEKLYNVDSRLVIPLFGVNEIITPLEYKSLMENISINLNNTIIADIVDTPYSIDFENQLLKSDYLIDKKGGFLGSSGSKFNIRKKYLEVFEKYKKQFEIIGKVMIKEDGSYILIFRNKKPIEFKEYYEYLRSKWFRS